MSALLMLMLVTVGIYGAWLPTRESESRIELDEKAAGRGSILFARNCRLCHGDVGEGGALGGRLTAATALDRTDLQGFADSDETLAADISESSLTLTVSAEERFQAGHILLINDERIEVQSVNGAVLTVKRGISHTEAAEHRGGTPILLFDQATLDEQIDLITNTLTCGRVGTAMPAWALQQGGPLSDEQIRQLMIVITQGRWELVDEEVDHEDFATTLTETVTKGMVSFAVENVTLFNPDEAIRIGNERLRVFAAFDTDGDDDSDSGILVVERGIIGTVALDHPADAEIFRFPETPETSINEQACGQTARAQTGTPELIEPFDGQTTNLIAKGIAFDISEIRLEAGGQVRIRLDNQDVNTEHNIAIYQSADDLTEVSAGSIGLIFLGPEVDDTVFDVPEVGTYFFRCDAHPTLMVGELIVE